MLEAVSAGQVELILEITDRLEIHREAVVIPLPKRGAGQVRRRPDGKLEIVVPAEREFGDWLGELEGALRDLV